MSIPMREELHDAVTAAADQGAGGVAFGQRDRLTRRLRGLIRAYPEGIGIIKELLQNADDAGARLMRVILDGRTHPASRLPDVRMHQLLGPAILVYNDAAFSDRDFDHIQEIGLSAKTDALWKTGQFGFGFNAVYNVTDWPGFISRDRMIIFDPHRSAVQRNLAGDPGWCWFLTQAGWWDQYPDLMRAYEAGGLPFGTTDFRGALFRLPLRTAAQAARSEIRKEPFA